MGAKVQGSEWKRRFCRWKWGMNGLEVLERIKKDYPYLKVIMLSAMCTEEIVRKSMELGADSFVAKPFQACALLERI